MGADGQDGATVAPGAVNLAATPNKKVDTKTAIYAGFVATLGYSF